jgi:hypothetical protein
MDCRYTDVERIFPGFWQGFIVGKSDHHGPDSRDDNLMAQSNDDWRRADIFEMAEAMTRDAESADRYHEIANRLYNRAESAYNSAMEIRYNVQ